MKIAEIKSFIETCEGLVIEIAGPTLHGYSFMKENDITMPSRLIVTNVSKKIHVWNRVKNLMELHRVDDVADSINLPYGDNSVSILFVSNLSITASHGSEAINAAKHEYMNPLRPTTNLHLFLYKEALRVLVHHGLIIQVGAFVEDLSAFSGYMFTKEYLSTKGEGTLILRKISKLV